MIVFNCRHVLFFPLFTELFEIYRIFPIPNNGSFHLHGKVVEHTLVILNALASVVYEKELNDDLEERMIQTDLSSGTYIVILTDANGYKMYHERIVILL